MSAVFVLRGQDQVTGTLSAVGVSLGQVTDKVEGMSKANEKGTDSVVKVMSGFQGLANVGFAAYNAIDRIETAQYALEKANLAVKRATENVENAQTAYNKAVAKGGEDTDEAKQASDKLRIAQDALGLANERVHMTQNNVNSSMVSAALTIIPSIITVITSVTGITKAWHGAQAALNIIMNANPIMLIVTAIGLLITGIILAYTYCEPFRNAINAIGSAIYTFVKPAIDAIVAGLTWLWNNVLAPLAGFIVGYFIASWKALEVVWSALTTAVNVVSGALSWFWNNVLVPIASFLTGTLLAAWNSLASGISWAYNTFMKPIFDALSWVYNNVLKPVGDFFGGIGSALSGIGGAVSNLISPAPVGPKHGQAGGIIDKPTMLIAGEAGPEALIPLGSAMSSPAPAPLIFEETVSPTIIIEINAPMVLVQGSADIRTARLAANMVQSSLKNVVIEASSIAASETHKTVRLDTSSLSSVGAGASSVLAAPKSIGTGKLREFSEKFY